MKKTDLKIKLLELIDNQSEEHLQEIYDLLSSRFDDKTSVSAIEQGYQEMATDTERENEAHNWIEGTLNSEEI